MRPRIPSPLERSLIYADLLLAPPPPPAFCLACERRPIDCCCASARHRPALGKSGRAARKDERR
jgi:hypothetical protein